MTDLDGQEREALTRKVVKRLRREWRIEVVGRWRLWLNERRMRRAGL
jgi:hypothetical protein